MLQSRTSWGNLWELTVATERAFTKPNTSKECEGTAKVRKEKGLARSDADACILHTSRLMANSYLEVGDDSSTTVSDHKIAFKNQMSNPTLATLAKLVQDVQPFVDRSNSTLCSRPSHCDGLAFVISALRWIARTVQQRTSAVTSQSGSSATRSRRRQTPLDCFS